MSGFSSPDPVSGPDSTSGPDVVSGPGLREDVTHGHARVGRYPLRVRCPSCSGGKDRVVDSREVEGGGAIRRRRECLLCGHRFTTVERAAASPLIVEKRSGEREPFQLAKVVAGITAACKNRPVTDAAIRSLAASVEESCRLGGTVVTTQRLGVAVLDGLRDLDDVAYLRFASVYKGFEDADDFAREAVLLTKATAPKVHERSRIS